MSVQITEDRRPKTKAPPEPIMLKRKPPEVLRKGTALALWLMIGATHNTAGYLDFNGWCLKTSMVIDSRKGHFLTPEKLHPIIEKQRRTIGADFVRGPIDGHQAFLQRLCDAINDPDNYGIKYEVAR